MALLLALTAMIMLAIGAWRIEATASRNVPAILLCLCGLVPVVVAAAQAGPSWGLRIATVGLYSGAGGSLGVIAASISAKRRAGAILATPGTAQTAGFKIVAAIGIACGLIGVIAQAMDRDRPAPILLLAGQGLLFSTFAIQAFISTRSRWTLTDHGILGAFVFVPWRQVSAWEWRDSNTIAIALKPGFRRAKSLAIPVLPDAHELAAAILTTKISA